MPGGDPLPPIAWLLVKSGHLHRIIVQVGWEKRTWGPAIQAGMYWQVGIGGGGGAHLISHIPHVRII